MKKTPILLALPAAVFFLHAAEPVVKPTLAPAVKPAPAAAKNPAAKYDEAKRYLDRLEGNWVGKEVLMAPDGRVIKLTTQLSYTRKPDKKDMELTTCFSAHAISGLTFKHEGLVRLEKNGTLVYEVTLQSVNGHAFSKEEQPGQTSQAFIRDGGLVCITKNDRGEAVAFTSDEFVKENGADVIKAMGFIVIPLDGGSPLKLRSSSEFHRKK